MAPLVLTARVEAIRLLESEKTRSTLPLLLKYTGSDDGGRFCEVGRARVSKEGEDERDYLPSSFIPLSVQFHLS